MTVEDLLKRIKMSAFQASIITILSIMSIYTIYRTETFISKVHKAMATLNHSMAQAERAMAQFDRAEAVTQTLVERSAALAPASDKDKDKTRAKPKAPPHIKVAASMPAPDKPTQPPATNKN